MKAIIFDMDGVLVDSTKYWFPETVAYYARVIDNWSIDEAPLLSGKSYPDSYDMFFSQGRIHITKDVFMSALHTMAHSIYITKAKLLPEVVRVLDRLKTNNIPCALASSSPRAWVSLVLERFELTSYFSVVVGADDIAGASKPSPDIYLHAAHLLGALPADCFVIEDSANGIQSARSAGMYAIVIKTTDNANQDISQANASITTLTDIYRIIGIV